MNKLRRKEVDHPLRKKSKIRIRIMMTLELLMKTGMYIEVSRKMGTLRTRKMINKH